MFYDTIIKHYKTEIFPIVLTSATAKEERRMINMERNAKYQFRVLPSDPNSYMTLDAEPKRKSEANLVYTITEDVFAGIDIKFRIRHRAKEFARSRGRGKVFAVIYKNDENHECLYFGNLNIKERDFLKPHTQPVLYLTRCVGSNISKKHFSKVSKYILAHYKDIYELELGNVIEANL